MMTLQKVEHLLRAAGDATGQTNFVLVGSAAIFLWRANVPDDLAMSREADLFAPLAELDAAERVADELDAILGQASPFDEEYGYYCDGVGPETAILPVDWQDRAKRYVSSNTNGVSALAPEPNDLALSKLVAGREKDMLWLAAAAQAAIVDLDVMGERIHLVPADQAALTADTLRERLTAVRARLLKRSG